MDSLRCPLCCLKEFRCKKELIDHLNSVQSSLKCPICSKETQDLSSLIFHLESLCKNDSEGLPGPSFRQAETSTTLQSSNHTDNVISDVIMGNSRDSKIIPLRKRRKSNLAQLSKRKTLGKNNSNENAQFTSESENMNKQDDKPTCDNLQNQPTTSSAAESEVDLDNVSMLSDESSFTTNDYSSSQNEIISDDDCNENAVDFPHRAQFQSNSYRHAALLRNSSMQNQGSTGFINNLQVINNNFYTVLLNNGSYEDSTLPNHNTPHERNGNYQRRNTKNNNSQLNNCQASSSASSEEHGTIHHNVTTQNNLQTRKVCKNSNLIPINYTNVSSTSNALPVSNMFTVTNNSPHKYSVKNTNISNNIPVGAKEISTANLASRNSVRLSTCVNNTNETEENSQVNHNVTRTTDDSPGFRGSASPVNENSVDAIVEESADNASAGISSQSSHPVITRSSSNRMQKIQNADCIQNSTSSYTLTPSASALCKTNSFPLCNYIQSNQAPDKSKLIKYNANPTGVRPRMSSENEVMFNNVPTPNNSQGESSGNMVTNGTSSDRYQETSLSHENNRAVTELNIETVETDEPSKTQSYELVRDSEATTSQNPINFVCNNNKSCDSNSNGFSTCAEERMATIEHATGPEVDNNEPSQANAFQFTAQNIPSTLNNLNNSAINTISATTQNICSLTNNLHKNKKSNLNQLGRRNVSKEEKMFTVGKSVSGPSATAIVSEASGQGSYQMINNSIERNFNKLNSCSQEINTHKNVKTNPCSKRNKKSRKPQPEQFGGYYDENFSASSMNYSLPGTSSSSSNVEASSNVTASSASSITTIADTHSSTGANVFDKNNAMQSNQSKALFNNKNQLESTDKNISNVSNRKELVSIKRNNFLCHQEHSNIRRSNSLNVKINDLAAGSSSGPLSDGKISTRKSIIKSNSFTIRNNICEASTSQSAPEGRNYSNNFNRTVDSKDGSSVAMPNETTSNFHVGDGLELEQFRLEEATNSNDRLHSTEDNTFLATETLEIDNQNNPLEAFSCLVLNNAMENSENYQGSIPSTQIKSGSSNSGSATTSSPQMIHNNIEPRCKKNKKCNEERGPLKPINSENKRKSNDE